MKIITGTWYTPGTKCEINFMVHQTMMQCERWGAGMMKWIKHAHITPQWAMDEVGGFTCSKRLFVFTFLSPMAKHCFKKRKKKGNKHMQEVKSDNEMSNFFFFKKRMWINEQLLMHVWSERECMLVLFWCVHKYLLIGAIWKQMFVNAWFLKNTFYLILPLDKSIFSKRVLLKFKISVYNMYTYIAILIHLPHQ